MVRSSAYVTVMTLLVLASSGSTVEAQDWFLDVAFDQSFSSNDPLRSPSGFSVGAGVIALWGPVGVHASYRDVADAGDDIVLDCADGPASCVPGTLGVTYQLKAAGVGISYDFINPTGVMLTLAVTGTRNWRREKVRHSATGQAYDHELSASLGVAASAHLRLRPLGGGMRPELGLHYRSSGRGDCVAGAACWQGRRALGISVGFSWVLRTGRD